MRILEGEGLIYPVPGLGYFVCGTVAAVPQAYPG
jgi:hypothetical protein